MPFFLENMRFLSLHFKLSFWKCKKQASSPPGEGSLFWGFSPQTFYLAPENLQLILVIEAELWIDFYHLLWAGSYPSHMIAYLTKENVFLYLLDVYHVHTAKLGYVLFPLHSILSKEVLYYLFKDPQNKYFSWFPPPLLPNNNYNINNKPQSS